MANIFVKNKDKAAIIKADIEKKAQALKKEIVESESDYSEVIGKIYYVSENTRLTFSDGLVIDIYAPDPMLGLID